MSLQVDFLTPFFATGASRRFFLTGGSALPAFHLPRRLSVDKGFHYRPGESAARPVATTRPGQVTVQNAMNIARS